MRTPFTIAMLLLLFSLKAQVDYKSSYVAGDEVIITFHENIEGAMLMVNHSYGATLVSGERSGKDILFKLPTIIAKKSGKLDLKVIVKEQTIWSGSTVIRPDTIGSRTIESYCGPKHLVVAVNDFTMLTSTVLDKNDNPYPASTIVSARALIENSISAQAIESDGLTAYARIYAPQQSGNGAVSAVYNDVSSKEFRLDFYANDPENYTLSHTKQHAYADGNQLIEIKTSEIKDPYGNQLENGTLVYFQFLDSFNRLTSATAATINGIAKIEIPAPNYQTIWQVSSIIPNYAKSNELNIKFERSILELPISETPKELVVGPVRSFLGQVAKEGMLVTVKVTSAERSFLFEIPLKDGFATLNYSSRLVPTGSYQATVELGDLKETLNITVPAE